MAREKFDEMLARRRREAAAKYDPPLVASGTRVRDRRTGRLGTVELAETADSEGTIFVRFDGDAINVTQTHVNNVEILKPES